VLDRILTLGERVVERLDSGLVEITLNSICLLLLQTFDDLIQKLNFGSLCEILVSCFVQFTERMLLKLARKDAKELRQMLPMEQLSGQVAQLL
jgi:hypothetical protein